MNARDATIPLMRPFLPATTDFKTGTDSPTDFLERCISALDAWEPRIGAFVSVNLVAAREAADRSTERWGAGRPLSPIDGMPIGVKDIMETIDMPTEYGSPLFAGFRGERDSAGVAALREAGAVILGKTVTTEFGLTEPLGTRNPWDLSRTPGGSSSGSPAAVAVGAVSVGLGTQVLGSILRPASFCGCFGFKPTFGALNRGGSYDALSQSTHGPLAASLPDAWQVAFEISRRAGGDPGFPGLYGPSTPPAPRKPQRLAVLETDGWGVATPIAKEAFEDALAKLKSAGVALESRHRSDEVRALEAAIQGARDLSIRIMIWESRWPINTYRARDSSKLSKATLDRCLQAEAMTLDDYRRDLKERDERRASYHAQAAEFDACITLAASGAAPVGLASTGDPTFASPASMLGVPAITLPVLHDGGLPLGLQLLGWADCDSALFSTAGGVWPWSSEGSPARTLAQCRLNLAMHPDPDGRFALLAPSREEPVFPPQPSFQPLRNSHPKQVEPVARTFSQPIAARYGRLARTSAPSVS
jgi:Asp-tRNA(Asn)/Glu-tRNA(Gln) amidotransferase A subunit family amidase